MRLHRLVVPSAVALAAAVGLPAPAQAAPAQCSLVMPAKLVLDPGAEDVNHRLSSNCAAVGAAAASWHVVRVGGGHDWWVDLDDEVTDGVELFPSAEPIGTYRAYPAGAEQADGEPLTQNTPQMLVKYGARTSLTGRYFQRRVPGASRTVTELALTATAVTWSGSTDDWYPRAGAQVQLLRHKGGDWWVRERNGTTHSQGKVTFRIPSYSSATYRVRVVETAKAWASGSGTFRATPQ